VSKVEVVLGVSRPVVSCPRSQMSGWQLSWVALLAVVVDSN